MQMLYDSDSFVVLHLQPDLGLPAEILLTDGQTSAPGLPRHGFEIVDKAADGLQSALWLAPGLQYLPVRIRMLEDGGRDELDLKLQSHSKP